MQLCIDVASCVAVGIPTSIGLPDSGPALKKRLAEIAAYAGTNVTNQCRFVGSASVQCANLLVNVRVSCGFCVSQTLWLHGR